MKERPRRATRASSKVEIENSSSRTQVPIPKHHSTSKLYSAPKNHTKQEPPSSDGNEPSRKRKRQSPDTSSPKQRPKLEASVDGVDLPAISPFPTFLHPTENECKRAHKVLDTMHHDAVEQEFQDEYTPETIPNVLDAMLVAILSQATSWNNAKRAMKSMKNTYGSQFAYDAILAGGRSKLEDTIRCGGLHVRKSMIIISMLEEVKRRKKKWDMNHLFQSSTEEAMSELTSFKYIGPKSAGVVVGWSLKRSTFIVDTHVYRIAGLWNWRPEKANKEKTQLHLDAMIPNNLKMSLHFLLIAHGRTCPVCKGGSKSTVQCTARKEILDSD